MARGRNHRATNANMGTRDTLMRDPRTVIYYGDILDGPATEALEAQNVRLLLGLDDRVTELKATTTFRAQTLAQNKPVKERRKKRGGLSKSTYRLWRATKAVRVFAPSLAQVRVSSR